MAYLNVEIKARCSNPGKIRELLFEEDARFIGVDLQTDTYFQTVNGRLKLREGNIENSLIYYERPDQPGMKQSNFTLVKIEDAKGLKSVLTSSLGIKTIVHKSREIYYIDNVKFHIDEVNGLGSFVEIEAGNMLADLSKAELEAQCAYYLELFGIESGSLIEYSYSDMILAAT